MEYPRDVARLFGQGELSWVPFSEVWEWPDSQRTQRFSVPSLSTLR